mmetsp:Transcript_34421/g.109944  ORF Transcript_34421/g.109944 Transcript_34421/m.109944 type:complete len:123 (-) Transcript_34421:639-1007(-)
MEGEGRGDLSKSFERPRERRDLGDCFVGDEAPDRLRKDAAGFGEPFGGAELLEVGVAGLARAAAPEAAPSPEAALSGACAAGSGTAGSAAAAEERRLEDEPPVPKSYLPPPARMVCMKWGLQ